MKKSQHLGELDPNRIIGPVEDLNIFQVLEDSGIDVRVPNVEDPKTTCWVNVCTNTFQNLRLLLKRKIKTSARPKKASQSSGRKLIASDGTLEAADDREVRTQSHQSASTAGNCCQDQVPTVWSVVPHGKRSRVKRTHTLRKSLVASSVTQDERAQMDRCFQKVT